MAGNRLKTIARQTPDLIAKVERFVAERVWPKVNRQDSGQPQE